MHAHFSVDRSNIRFGELSIHGERRSSSKPDDLVRLVGLLRLCKTNPLALPTCRRFGLDGPCMDRKDSDFWVNGPSVRGIGKGSTRRSQLRHTSAQQGRRNSGETSIGWRPRVATDRFGSAHMAMGASMQPPMDDRQGPTLVHTDSGSNTSVGYTIPELPRTRTSSNASLSPSKQSIPLPKSPQGFSPVAAFGDEVDDPCEQMMKLSAKSLPKSKKLIRDSGFPFGCVLSPLAARTPVPSTTDEPEFCASCGAAINLYANLDFNRNVWTCPLCSQVNHIDAWPSSFLGEESPYLTCNALDFEGFGASLDTNELVQLESYSDMTMFPTLFLIDAYLDEEDLEELKESLLSAFRALPGCCQVGIITFGSSVSVYDLSDASQVVADVLPGRESPTIFDLKPILMSSRVPILPVDQAREVAESIILSLRPFKNPQKVPARLRPRCLGSALEVAISLIKNYGKAHETGELGSDMSVKMADSTHREFLGGHVLVMTSGPCTLGPGSVVLDDDVDHSQESVQSSSIKYFTRVADEARSSGMVIDVLCGGLGIAPGVSYMLPLVQETGGALLLHEGFGKLACSTIKTASCQPVFTNASFDVRLSPGMRVTQLIGPIAEVGVSKSQKPARNALSGNAVQVLGLSNSTGIVVCFDPSGCKNLEYAYMQCITRWTQPGGNNVTRILTKRMPCTESEDQFLEGICGQAAALVLAKKVAVSEDMFTDVEAVREGVEKCVGSIARIFVRKADTDRGKLPRLPEELSTMAEGLYNLHRGALVGRAFGHADERMALASQFIATNYELSQMMIVPVVYQSWGSKFEILPPVDMVMQTSCSFLLDCGAHVYIWIGQNSSGASKEECRKLANKLCGGRWPTPVVKEAREGSSAQRYVTARLWPMRREPWAEQVHRIPNLAGLDPEECFNMVEPYFRTEEPSFYEWLRELGFRPPDPVYAAPYYHYQALAP